MSSLASVTSERNPLVLIRFADVALVVMALPFALLAGAPAFGYAIGASAWTAQRFAEEALDRRARRMDDFRWTIGLNFAGIFVRVWLVGLCVIVAGRAGEREDGLTAAILVFVAFTVYLAGLFVARSLDRSTPK